MTGQDKTALTLTAAAVLVLIGAMVVVNRSAGPGPEPPTTSGAPAGPAVPADQRVATISEGQRVEVSPYLVPGRRTVVEFTAGW